MIKAIISDFDGTLVDTFKANYLAYQQAFNEMGLTISENKYRECFGLRYDAFMSRVGIIDDFCSVRIKELKQIYYPQYFEYLIPNTILIDLIKSFHSMGGVTAIASTASKENLMNAVCNFEIENNFDVIYAGIDVSKGKPDPEIYFKTMNALGVIPEETLIFEDSDIGVNAAIASGAKYIRVTDEWFRTR